MTKKEIAEHKRMLKERALIPIPEREIGCYLCDSKPKIKDSYMIPMRVEDVGDNDTGSLYQTRICNQNASDYTGTLSERHGGSTLDGFGITQDTTNKDKFSASVGGGI